MHFLLFFFQGYMLNLCSILLEFFLPIGQSLEKLQKVDLGYSVSSTCRLTYDFEPCLAAGQIGTEFKIYQLFLIMLEGACLLSR